MQKAKNKEQWDISKAYLGSEPGSKAYRLFDIIKKRICVSRNIKFKEDKTWNWKDIAMSSEFSEGYDQAFRKLFEQYLQHPQEHYSFALKRFGKLPSIKNQEVGGLTNRIQSQSGYTIDYSSESSVGGITKSKDQKDQNTAGTQATDQIKECMTQGVQESEEEDPSIMGYYSDRHEDLGESTKEDDDFVIIV